MADTASTGTTTATTATTASTTSVVSPATPHSPTTVAKMAVGYVRNPSRTGLRRVVAIVVIGTVALNGCASTRQSVSRDLADRIVPLKSIALVTLEVSVYEISVTGRRLVPEWSDTARANLTEAIAGHFGGDGHFAFREIDTTALTSAKEEIEQPGSRIALLTVREINAESPERIRCLPGPAPALTEATGADALLLL